MQQHLFSPLHVNNLGIDNLYAIVKTTIEVSAPVKTSMSDLAKAALAVLETVNADMEKRMKKTLGSALTPELQAMNTQRNKLFAEIKRFTTNANKSSSATLKAAGSAYKIFLTPYWNTETEPLNTISGIYEEVLDRYHADQTLQTAATTLDITTLLTDLESVNTNYDKMYKDRNAEVSNKTGNSASELKDEAVHAYEQYCTAIEQSVSLMPNEKLLALFAEMDGLRRKYAVIKPKARKKDNDNNPDKPETETGPGPEA